VLEKHITHRPRSPGRLEDLEKHATHHPPDWPPLAEMRKNPTEWSDKIEEYMEANTPHDGSMSRAHPVMFAWYRELNGWYAY
jgi:hypothetical protein